jgi:hypothetical protein
MRCVRRTARQRAAEALVQDREPHRHQRVPADPVAHQAVLPVGDPGLHEVALAQQLGRGSPDERHVACEQTLEDQVAEPAARVLPLRNVPVAGRQVDDPGHELLARA